MLCYTRDKLEEIRGTVLFLGDSITDQGQFVSFLNCYLELTDNHTITLVNAGVSSETCSGLSEPSHPFPRPCVQGRVASALEKVQPDWVVFSYGINDGIYYPYSEERFAAYKNGITALVNRVHQSGAKVVVMTPLFFDEELPGLVLGDEQDGEFSYRKPYRHYDRVLERYSRWIMTEGWTLADAVIDLRTPILADVAELRRLNGDYRSGDGIHPNLHGHYVMAKTILRHLFGVATESLEKRLQQDDWMLFNRVYQRDQLEHAYYKELIGHDTPDKNQVPTDWWEQVQRLNEEIRLHLANTPALKVLHSMWEGFQTEEFIDADGYEVVIAKPERAAEGRPWVWRTEFFGAFPWVDLELLRRGWHVAQLRIPDLYGCPRAVALMSRFQRSITERFSLSPQAVLFGFSRGGLYAIHYAASYPERVQMLYLDAPVVVTDSWPKGQYSGVGAPEQWRQCRAAYDGAEQDDRWEQALERLLAAKLPLMLVAGDGDTVVPYPENGALLAQAYAKSGLPLQVIIKKGVGHHPHSLENPDPIVAFILDHSARRPGD